MHVSPVLASAHAQSLAGTASPLLVDPVTVQVADIVVPDNDVHRRLARGGLEREVGRTIRRGGRGCEDHAMPGASPFIAGAWMDRMFAFWSPGWTVGGCALSVAVALAARGRLARSAHMSPRAATVYLAALGATLAVTLSPRSPNDTYFVFGATERACELVPTGLDLHALVWSAEWQFNVLLLVPLGAACRSGRHRSWRVALVGVAATVPVAIEAAQYAATSLHRVCQGTDVLTNWLGLFAGYAVASVALRVTVHASGGADESISANGRPTPP
jgi:hypothetical protein